MTESAVSDAAPVLPPVDDPAEGTPEGAAPARLRRPRLVQRETAGVFGALAAARGDRSMHGPGIAFRARLEMTPPPGVLDGAPFFARARTYDATIRFSRGIGLPQPAADLLGVAVRVQDAHPGGRPQDLRVTSSGGRRARGASCSPRATGSSAGGSRASCRTGPGPAAQVRGARRNVSVAVLSRPL